MALQEEFEKQGVFLFKYRSILPLIVIVLGLLVFAANWVLDIPYQLPISFHIVQFISLAISLLGLLIRIYTVGHTPANTSGRNTESQVAEKLNTTGIYSTVRHPLYLGNFLMWLGIAILTVNFWFIISFILLYWVYYERIMYAEEQFLRRKFGESYINWSAITPAFMMSFKKTVKPNLPFSWKKVVKKEKNGLLAIFVLLYIFDTLSNSLTSRMFQAELNWIAYATLATGFSYIILKYLKHRTSVLNEEGR